MSSVSRNFLSIALGTLTLLTAACGPLDLSSPTLSPTDALYPTAMPAPAAVTEPASNPREAIVNFVRLYPTHSEPNDDARDSVMPSLRFIKSRTTPGLEVHAIQWRDTTGDTWSWIVSVTEISPGIWQAGGGGGGNGPQPLDHPFSPSAYFVGSWGSGLAVGGSWVSDLGGLVASVRLVEHDKVLDQDVVENHVVLFIARYTSWDDVIVELVGPDGSIIKRHQP